MYTYDMVVGIKIGPTHNRTLSFERVVLDSNEESAVYKRLWEVTSNALTTTLEIPNRDDIIQCLSIIQSKLSADVITKDDLDLVDNCFDVIAYLGIEVDAFRRDDMVPPVTEQKSIMAYIVNTKVEDIDDRIAPSIGITTDDISLGSLTDIVMESFHSKIRFNPALEAIIKLNTQIENWSLMSEVGASSNFDVTRLYSLLQDMGFKIKIFVGN